MTSCSADGLRAPAGAAAAHAAEATPVTRHDGAANGTDGRISHVNQLLQRVGGVHVAGLCAAGKTQTRLIAATIGVPRLRRTRSGCASARDDKFKKGAGTRR